MSLVTLPIPGAYSGIAEWSNVLNNDVALREVVNGQIDSENLKKEGIEGSRLKKGTIEPKQLAAESRPITWYKPSVIATEEPRENVAFGTLTTPDEIKEVVLPENGWIILAYSAAIKSSVNSAGRAAIFLGANQLKVDAGGANPAVQEAATTSTNAYQHLFAIPGGLETQVNAIWGGDVTTGQALGGVKSVAPVLGFACGIFAAAGTYNISVQFKATSGSVTAKGRKLWVAVLGV